MAKKSDLPFFVKVMDLAEPGLSIGYRNYYHKEHKDLLIKQTWNARIYLFESKQTVLRSLKLPYEDSMASIRLAQQKAGEVYRKAMERVKLGLKPSEKLELEKVTEDWYEEAALATLRNQEDLDEGLTPQRIIAGARNPITQTRLEELGRLYDKFVLPFFDKTGLLKKNINAISINKLRDYPDWFTKQKWFTQNGRRYNPSPATVNRCLTVIKSIWHYARKKDYVIYIPDFDRPKDKDDDAKRGKITEDLYTKMIMEAQQNYEERPFLKGTINSSYHQDLAEQFYIYIKLLSWVGFRPPSGGTDRTLLRWDDIIISNRGTPEETWYLNRTEKVQKIKAKPVQYIIQKPVRKDLLRLKELYKERHIEWTPYIFAHTHDGQKNIQAGDNIRGFRRQWENLLCAVGQPNEKHAPQSERISFYSLRGYYMTCRIRHGKLSIDDVAKMCNTSPEMVRRVYREWDIEREAPNLQQGIPDDYLLEAIS